MLKLSLDSSVCIATCYGLDGPEIESRWGRDFLDPSRPGLGPTQPPVQWVPGLGPGVKSSRGVTLTPHPLLVPWSRKSRAMCLFPLWAVRPVQSLSACTRVPIIVTIYTLSNPCTGVEVEAPEISWQSAYEWGKVSPTYRPSLLPRKYFCNMVSYETGQKFFIIR